MKKANLRFKIELNIGCWVYWVNQIYGIQYFYYYKKYLKIIRKNLYINKTNKISFVFVKHLYYFYEIHKTFPMKRIIFALILLSSIHAYTQNCVEEIVCSEFTVAAIMENGDTYYWGDNEYGHYGDGTTENQTIMLQWNESIISVGLSQRHTSIIKEDGTIWSWGQNALGQLGDGTTDESLVPVQTGSDDDWIEISSGFYHSIALKEDGTLWGWGNNGAYEVSYTGEIHKELL